tara:strand:+ start:935 stop:1153 length:219 start_codon:yes stop_codon:yes gene_type:complete
METNPAARLYRNINQQIKIEDEKRERKIPEKGLLSFTKKNVEKENEEINDPTKRVMFYVTSIRNQREELKNG